MGQAKVIIYATNYNVNTCALKSYLPRFWIKSAKHISGMLVGSSTSVLLLVKSDCHPSCKAHTSGGFTR